MLKRLADVLVGYSTEVQQGDIVRDRVLRHVGASGHARDLRRGVAGRRPSDARTWCSRRPSGSSTTRGGDDQLDWIPPDQPWNIEHGDVWIIFDAVTNTKRLTNVDPERISRRLTAREPAAVALPRALRAGRVPLADLRLRCEASAQDAGMSLPAVRAVLSRAAFLDADDPVAAWKQFGERLERVGDFLERCGSCESSARTRT